MTTLNPHPSTSSLPPDNTGDGGQAWYVVLAKPRQERVAETNLIRQGYVCFFPTMQVERLSRGRTAIVEEPMFARYLFVRLGQGLNDRSWTPIRSTLGVSQLVRFGTRAARIDDAVVEHLRLRSQQTPAQRLYKEGDAVKIVSGPFVGLEAIFQAPTAQARSMVLIELLTKRVNLEIDTAQLRAAA